MALERETGTLLDALSSYWEHIAAAGAAAAAIYGVWRKFARKRIKAASEWVRAAATLPLTLKQIQTELQFENGVTLRDQMLRIGEDLHSIKNIIAVEITVRRSMLQGVETPIFECGKDGKLMWANAAFLGATGRELGQVEGWNWRNIIIDPDREDMMANWRQAVEDGTDYRGRFRMIHDGAGDKWMLFDAVCVKDDLQNVVGFVGKLLETRDPRAGI